MKCPSGRYRSAFGRADCQKPIDPTELSSPYQSSCMSWRCICCCCNLRQLGRAQIIAHAGLLGVISLLGLRELLTYCVTFWLLATHIACCIC